MPILGLTLLFCSDYLLAKSTKLNARLGMASFTSTSQATPAGGTVQSTGAPEFTYNFFLKPHLAIYLGADFFPAKQEGGVSLWGIKMGAKYYFYHLGVPIVRKTKEIESVSYKRWSAYGLGEVKQYNYFLGTNPSITNNEIEEKGTFFNYNIGLGVDYRINTEWDLNFEISNPILTQASTDDRINYSGRVILMGLGYHF